MNKLLIIAAVCAAAVLASSCVAVRGSGTKAEDSRQVPAFSSISFNGSYSAELAVGGEATETVTVLLTGDDNIVPLIDTVVEGGVLTIDSEKNLWTDLPLTVKATPFELDGITINGSADVNATGIHGPKINVEVNGSGDVTLSGQAEAVKLEVNGSGDVQARDLKATSVTIEIAGSGDVEVCASKSLSVDIAGSGAVTYYCNPSVVNQDIAGSGELIKK